MPNVILVVLWRPEAADTLLRAGERLAELSGGGAVGALAVQPPPTFEIYMADGNIPEEVLARMRADGRERIARLRAAFERWAAEARAAPFPAHWAFLEANPLDPVRDRGSRADFVVISRPSAGHGWAERQAFETALFRTERPLLVVPPDHPAAATFGRRVGIAWRDDGRAAKAVLPALRCLAGAERVALLCGVRGGAAPPAVPAILREHEVQVEQHVLPIGPGPFGQALLAAAHAFGADLLVMGAYAHSPLREMILGGVTRWMLAHADLPLLMRH
ncbi:universal stress protein [Crenalkalicoccus roseus]|uniref:universal stress protein n=1 Tax=Crenalkalicoccus roseus TaxID=1485588 RepID=UPI00108084F8|nr:universal stress protein [Crenalkalicoccus roseus]